jgi:hypothetical protein
MPSELATRFMFWPQIPMFRCWPLMARLSAAIRITQGAPSEGGAYFPAMAPIPPRASRGSKRPGELSTMGAMCGITSSFL